MAGVNVPVLMKNWASVLFGCPVLAMPIWYTPVKASCCTGSVAIGGRPLDEAVLVGLPEPPWMTLNPVEASDVMRGMYFPGPAGTEPGRVAVVK